MNPVRFPYFPINNGTVLQTPFYQQTSVSAYQSVRPVATVPPYFFYMPNSFNFSNSMMNPLANSSNSNTMTNSFNQISSTVKTASVGGVAHPFPALLHYTPPKRPPPTLPPFNMISFEHHKKRPWTQCCFEDGVDKIPEEFRRFFTCVVCMEIPRALAMLKCGHILCQNCIHTIQQLSASPNQVMCPFCRSISTFSECRGYSDLNAFESQLFNSATSVSCWHGCGIKGSAPWIAKHEKEGCRLRYVLCPNLDCFHVMSLQDLKKYHFSECANLIPACFICARPQQTAHNCLEALKGTHLILFDLKSSLIYFNVY